MESEMKREDGSKILKELGYEPDGSVSYAVTLKVNGSTRRCGLGENGFTFRDIGGNTNAEYQPFWSDTWKNTDEKVFREKAKGKLNNN